MAEPIVLSGSSAGTYQRCPRQWYHEYVERQVRPPRLKMARGLAAHDAVEQVLRHKMDAWELMPREHALEIFSAEFDRVAADTPDTQGKETKADVKRRGLLAVGAWFDDVAPTIEPLFVEQNGQFTINEVHYDWTLDVLDQNGVIRDWKFVKSKPSGKMDDPYAPNYRLALIGYAVGLRQLTGDIETGIQLDYTVCTLNPYHMQTFEPTVTQEDIDDFRDTILEIHTRIRQGHYPPRGLSNRSCSWCAYTDGTCKAYEGRER